MEHLPFCRKGSQLVDRKVTDVNHGLWMVHQGVWHQSKITGKILLAYIENKPVYLEDVWLFPGLPNVTLSVPLLRKDPRFRISIDDDKTLITIKSSAEEKDQVYKARQDNVTGFDYICFKNPINETNNQNNKVASINKVVGTSNNIINNKIEHIHLLAI